MIHASVNVEKEEMGVLLSNGVFKIVHESEAVGRLTYGSRFVDQLKHAGLPDAYEKSRLVVQEFNDDKHGLLTYAPTVQCASQRLLLALCAIDPELRIFTCDISQAYTQSATNINHHIYVRPPAALKYPTGTLLYILKPLYGITEAEAHWFKIYSTHYTESLKMISSVYDTCFVFHPFSVDQNKNSPKGYTCLLTDEKLNAGNKAFIQYENDASIKFKSKPARHLDEIVCISFKRATISDKNGVYNIDQPVTVRKISLLNESEIDKAQVVSQRARGSYISAVCRPDLFFGFAIALQVTDPDLDNVKLLNKSLKRA